jgi:hypothetical protein
MQEIQALIEEGLTKEGCDCTATVSPGFIVLRIPPEERHYWSPQLTITLEETEEEGTVIRGLYGPNPTVWAMFFYGYAALGILGLFTAMVGTSQWMLKKPAPILWALPVFAGLALILYVIAQTGQKLGAEQTFTLHHFYEDTVGKRVHIA